MRIKAEELEVGSVILGKKGSTFLVESKTEGEFVILDLFGKPTRRNHILILARTDHVHILTKCIIKPNQNRKGVTSLRRKRKML